MKCSTLLGYHLNEEIFPFSTLPRLHFIVGTARAKDVVNNTDLARDPRFEF